MISFAFFLKTFSGDIDRVSRLVTSYRDNNVDDIPLYIMCPKDELSLFGSFQGDDITVLAEENLHVDVFLEDSHWSKGYLNQEIYKLAFWELGTCENYQCLDSDALFIRPFYLRDFMFDEHIPYTTLVEDKELQADCYYSVEYWSGRRKWISLIEDAIDYHPYKLLTCHGFQILNREVLKSLCESYLLPNGLSYRDIIEISPYEFTWYSLWIQKMNTIPIHICEPNFKTIHLKQNHIFEVLRGMTIDDWARGYVGLVVNSNYGVGIGDYNDLSVYDARNCGILDEIIAKNFEFYKKMLYGSRIGYYRSRINRLVDKVRRFFEY